MGLGGWIAPESTGRRAEVLFTQPFASSRQRALDASLEGAEMSTLQVAGESVVLYRWGDPTRQPLVLFSHGWSSFGLRVLPWLAPLRAAGYAVASFDQVAHGRSTGRHATLPGFGSVLTEVARQIGPVDSFVGHSLGAAAIALALANGITARRAVLIAPPADASEAAGRFARLIGLGDAALPALRQSAENRAGIEFDAISAQQVAPRISVPALVVHDLDDREVPWSEGERYARYWPQARLLTEHGLGHHRIVSDPGVIAAGMRFLAGETVGVRVVSTPNLPYGLA
ncbi:hypothetical protein N788_01695 [Arenimonas donghaensis DSM 18148 = HO3-R19]|uniref:AB hydrolase-1 domain-containing protein n=2 Tax=Arenimonas TaxID=490567 RepID=A0A087MM07_9GAMM|nr:hypothetical protein N788_01695 [Arenimonas donghaensis DSM 18148 = HO3-R19]